MAVVFVPKGTTDLSTLAINDGDTLVFAEGSQTVNAGLDLSDLDGAGAGALAAIYVLETFTGQIGTAADGPLVADVTGKIVYAAGGGMFFYDAGGASGTCAKVECLGAGRFHAVGDGSITALEVSRGYVHVAASVEVTHWRQRGGEAVQRYNATGNTSWYIEGGQLTSERGFSGTGNVTGGARVVVARVDSGSTLPSGGDLNVTGRAHIGWKGGNLGNVLLADDGAIDFGEAPKDLTVTSVSGSAQSLLRSNLASKYATVTISTKNQFFGTTDQIRGDVFTAPRLGGGGVL